MSSNFYRLETKLKNITEERYSFSIIYHAHRVFAEIRRLSRPSKSKKSDFTYLLFSRELDFIEELSCNDTYEKAMQMVFEEAKRKSPSAGQLERQIQPAIN